MHEYGNGLAFSYIDPRGGLSIPQLKSWDLMKYLSKHSINADASNLVHNVQRSLRIKNALYVDAMQCGNFTIDWRLHFSHYTTEYALEKQEKYSFRLFQHFHCCL